MVKDSPCRRVEMAGWCGRGRGRWVRWRCGWVEVVVLSRGCERRVCDVKSVWRVGV